MSTIFFTSQKNALKRDDTSGTALLGPPKTPAYITGGTPSMYVTNLTVSHGLGYPPMFRYYYEPFGDGVIWPSLSGRSQGNAINPLNLAQSGPGLMAWVDSTAPYDFHIQIFYSTNALTASFPVYYTIYRDFIL